MSNPQKRKGDRFELEAARALLPLLPAAAVVHRPQRLLGAGRRLDIGDLDVLPDTVIQVKAMADPFTAIREAAAGAAAQAANADRPYQLGMAPIPRARAADVRWLAAAHIWPTDLDDDEIAYYGHPALALRHVRNNNLGVPRRRRITVVRRTERPDTYLAPIEAWVAAYLTAHRAPGAAALSATAAA